MMYSIQPSIDQDTVWQPMLIALRKVSDLSQNPLILRYGKPNNADAPTCGALHALTRRWQSVSQAPTTAGTEAILRTASEKSKALLILPLAMPPVLRKDIGRNRPVALKRLFRALVGQLHPGRIWNPRDIGGRMILRRVPEYRTEIEPGGKGPRLVRILS